MLAGAVVSAGPAAHAGATPQLDPVCPQWSVSTVAAGYGMLENLAFDGAGDVLLSQSGLLGEGSVERVSAAGERSVLAPDIAAPGGLVVTPETVVVTTGNTVLPGLFGISDGTLQAIDRKTGEVRQLADGLVMPNGLAQLSNGDFVASRNVDGPAGGSGLTRIVVGDGSTPPRLAPFATSVRSANGVAFDARNNRLVVSTSFEPTTQLHLIDVGAPEVAPRTLTLPGAGPANAADDLAVAPDGTIYVALFGAGQIVRVDPHTGSSCVIAPNLPFVSSVAFGAGPGWDPTALYATSYDGSLRKLTAPAR